MADPFRGRTGLLIQCSESVIMRASPAHRGLPVSPAEAKIHILGVGSDGAAGLTARARELLGSAELLLGSEQTLSLVGSTRAEKVRLGSDLHETVRLLEANLGRKRIVVLAGGDPLVLRRRPLPLRPPRQGPLRSPAARQQHAARVCPHQGKLGRSVPDQPRQLIRWRMSWIASAPPTRSGCSPATTEDPPAIARQLLASGLDYFRAFVCENLGGPDERVTQGELAEIAEMEFAAAQRDDPEAETRPARSPAGRRRACGASATPTTSSPKAGPRAA